jgi:predicted nucleic acid-binding protein
MIVADASALFAVLDGAADGAKIEARLFARAQPVCAPHLIDAEIASILRKHLFGKRIPEIRANAALQDYLDMPLVRFPHTPLLPRVFALRDTMTARDAHYVALAESLGATLVTRDGRLARTAEGVCAVEVG